jgi:hypothetical protein
VRLDVIAKDESGKELFRDQKRYFQIGLDTEHYMRYGAWQIKEFYDLALQPKDTRRETFLMHFGKDTTKAEVEATVTYCLNEKKCDVIHAERRSLAY